VLTDCRTHSYRSNISKAARSRAPGIGRWPSFGVRAVAAGKRTGALVPALLAIGCLAPDTAPAAQPRRAREIKLTVIENQISTTNPNPAGPPSVGTTTVRAGVVSLTPGGRGADVDHVTITGVSLTTRTATFRGRVTFFFLTGTISGKSLGRATIHTDGSVTFTGATTLTSGTGAYQGVSGHLRFSGGSANKPGSVTTIRLVGTATY
jgi:hypothetical protein